MERMALEFVGNVAVLRFNHPEVMNAVGQQMLGDFAEAVEAIKDPANGARCLLLTGEGRGFCAGANLQDDAKRDGKAKPAGSALRNFYHPLMFELRSLEMPIVTAVNGAAAGVGMSFAMLGDIVCASKSGFFLQAFARIGLIPDGGSTFMLPRLVGWGRAMELSMLAERLPAEKAHEWGLVNRLFEDNAALMEGAMGIAQKLANGPRSLTLIRKAYWQTWQNSFEQQLELEAQLQNEAGASSDFGEGVKAFLEKRDAAFSGQQGVVMSLQGRVALVTGGSRGVGRAIAISLAKQGATVAVNYRRDDEAAEQTVAEIVAAGGSAKAYAASVDDFDQDAQMVAAIEADFGPVGILVNNAGIASRGQSVADTDPAELQRVVATHAFGPHYLAKLVLPGMRQLERGDIVMISSVATRSLGSHGAPYNMGKTAMEALAYTLAKEERRYGIRVNIVAPGLVETDMGKRLIKATQGVQDIRSLDDSMPFGRVCQPQDVANVVDFLVSSQNSYLTGERLYCDGGGPVPTRAMD